MNRPFAGSLILAFACVACGGGGDQGAQDTETAEVTEESSATEVVETMTLTTPEWMVVDDEARTVTLEVVAGLDDSNNRWNYNGYSRGNGTIVVPEGYEVTINFRNDDPNIAHSVGIDSQVGNYPATFQDPQPAFAGGMSPDPTSMQGATQPGESATLSFTPDAAGQYALVCYIPAHAATGMWIRFDVSGDGSSGFMSS